MSLNTNTTNSMDDTAELRYLREGFALIKRCEALCDSGRTEEAYRLLASNQTLLPDNVDFQSARACLLCELGYFEEALQTCDTALALRAFHDTALWWRAYALFMMERLNEALVGFDALLAHVPTYPNAAWMRAVTLHRLRGERSPIVMEAYDRAVAANAADPYVQVERADILRVHGRYEEARDAYALVRQPAFCDDAALRIDAAFKLGCVALVLNEVETARDAFLEVLKLDPNYPDARAMFEFIDLPSEP